MAVITHLPPLLERLQVGLHLEGDLVDRALDLAHQPINLPGQQPRPLPPAAPARAACRRRRLVVARARLLVRPQRLVAGDGGLVVLLLPFDGVLDVRHRQVDVLLGLVDLRQRAHVRSAAHAGSAYVHTRQQQHSPPNVGMQANAWHKGMRVCPCVVDFRTPCDACARDVFRPSARTRCCALHVRCCAVRARCCALRARTYQVIDLLFPGRTHIE